MTDHLHQHQHHNLNGTPSGRKESNCVRCRNHGLRVTLKGHKTYCPYATCTCDKCRFTAEQQRQMRLQNAIRRAEMHDKNGITGKKRKNSSSQESQNVTTLPQQSSTAATATTFHHQLPPPHSQHQQIFMTSVAAAAAAGQLSEDKKMLFDCSSELVKKFHCGWELMPIMYALSKYANGNMEEILRRIDEGQFAVNEQLRLQTLNMYFAGAGAAQQSNQNLPTITFVATRECG